MSQELAVPDGAQGPEAGVGAGSGPGLNRPVWIINGPNLARLGSREPEIYGTADAAALGRAVARWGQQLGFDVELRQSDNEAELVGWLHAAVDAGVPVILNPAAFTHYSYALRDAAALLRAAGLRLIEVHLSNPAARETFRHTSVVSGVAVGTIAGFGFGSYHLALVALADLGE